MQIMDALTFPMPSAANPSMNTAPFIGSGGNQPARPAAAVQDNLDMVTCAHGENRLRCKICLCSHNILLAKCCVCCKNSSYCSHGKRKAYCIPCGGNQICVHGKRSSTCLDCGTGTGVCIHKKVKYRCTECGDPKTFCSHGKKRSECRDCCGSSFCIHGKQKSRCAECGGSSICPHGKRRCRCKECGGSEFCSHGVQKSRCGSCSGASLCVHNRQRYNCRDCKGRALCIHQKVRSFCKDCGGSMICIHKKIKSKCRECSVICSHSTKKYKCSECSLATRPLSDQIGIVRDSIVKATVIDDMYRLASVMLREGMSEAMISRITKVVPADIDRLKAHMDDPTSPRPVPPGISVPSINPTLLVPVEQASESRRRKTVKPSNRVPHVNVPTNNRMMIQQPPPVPPHMMQHPQITAHHNYRMLNHIMDGHSVGVPNNNYGMPLNMAMNNNQRLVQVPGMQLAGNAMSGNYLHQPMPMSGAYIQQSENSTIRDINSILAMRQQASRSDIQGPHK